MSCAEVAQFRRDMAALDLGSMSSEEQLNAMFAAVSHITDLSRSVTSHTIAGRICATPCPESAAQHVHELCVMSQ